MAQLSRRDFLKTAGIALMGATAGSSAIAKVGEKELKALVDRKSGFTMWQLNTQCNQIGNTYVFVTDKGRVIVMDGGRIVFDVKGEQRSGMTVDDLLRKFAENAGAQLDNDRILLSN